MQIFAAIEALGIDIEEEVLEEYWAASDRNRNQQVRCGAVMLCYRTDRCGAVVL